MGKVGTGTEEEEEEGNGKVCRHVAGRWGTQAKGTAKVGGRKAVAGVGTG